MFRLGKLASRRAQRREKQLAGLLVPALAQQKCMNSRGMTCNASNLRINQLFLNVSNPARTRCCSVTPKYAQHCSINLNLDSSTLQRRYMASLAAEPTNAKRSGPRFPHELKGHVVIVTGGSRGIGLAVTQELLDAGASVVVVSRTEESLVRGLSKILEHWRATQLQPLRPVGAFALAAAEALREADQASTDPLSAGESQMSFFQTGDSGQSQQDQHQQMVIGLTCDVANANSVGDMFKQLQGLVPGIKATSLVCCAGICHETLLSRTDESKCNDMFGVNVLGAVYTTKLFLRQLPSLAPTVEQLGENPFRIVYFGSVVGGLGKAGVAVYAATKSALVGLTKSLAKEYKGRGITVNMIAPGFVTTDMTRNLDEAQKAALLRDIPLQRLGHPEDIAPSVRYLLGPWSRYMTGQKLSIDGGMS